MQEVNGWISRRHVVMDRDDVQPVGARRSRVRPDEQPAGATTGATALARYVERFSRAYFRERPKTTTWAKRTISAVPCWLPFHSKGTARGMERRLPCVLQELTDESL